MRFLSSTVLIVSRNQPFSSNKITALITTPLIESPQRSILSGSAHPAPAYRRLPKPKCSLEIQYGKAIGSWKFLTAITAFAFSYWRCTVISVPVTGWFWSYRVKFLRHCFDKGPSQVVGCGHFHGQRWIFTSGCQCHCKNCWRYSASYFGVVIWHVVDIGFVRKALNIDSNSLKF